VRLDSHEELVARLRLDGRDARGVKIAMPARTTAGTIVQMISSLVFPWICGPSTSSGVPRRRRKRMTKRTRAVSTATKTIAQIVKTTQ
jgi:hypothetical protein